MTSKEIEKTRETEPEWVYQQHPETAPLWEIALQLAVQNERNAAGDAVNRLLAKAAESRNLADPEPRKTDPAGDTKEPPEGFEPPVNPSDSIHTFRRGHPDNRFCCKCGAGEHHPIHDIPAHLKSNKAAAVLRSCAQTIQENDMDRIAVVDYLLKYAEAIEWHEVRREPRHHPHMKDEMDSAPEPEIVRGQTYCGQCQQDITGTDHRGKCRGHEEPTDQSALGFKPYCRWCRLQKSSWAESPICAARPRATEIRFPVIAPYGSRWGLWYGEGSPARTYDTEAEAREHLRNVLES